jgi:hypothetical protein
LKTHIAAATTVFKIDPADDHYLTLKAIGDRLDAAIKKASLVSSSIDELNLLLSTVNKGFQIAHTLTAA